MPAAQPFPLCKVLLPCALEAVAAEGVRSPEFSTALMFMGLLMQLGALKDAVRQMAQTKDAAAVQAIAPVQEQLQVPQGIVSNNCDLAAADNIVHAEAFENTLSI